VTPEPPEILACRTGRRKALLAIYVSMTIAVLVGFILWLVGNLVTLPVWLVAIVGGILAIVIIRGGVDLIQFQRRLRSRRAG
jgi:hypothetical protein